MEFILSAFHSSYSFLIPLLLLLGPLIFVHELGHFLVAKYFKVKVEVFSLGFGPKIFKYKWGETEYAISLIPFGGYVKMAGDDPSAELTEEEKAYAFLGKPVSQRIAVVLAGPLMNLFFAFFLFAALVPLGENVILNDVGDIDPKSEAGLAGFSSGDRIVSINDEKVSSWEDIQKKIEASPSTLLKFTVENELPPNTNLGSDNAEDTPLGLIPQTPSASTKVIQATPSLIKNILSWKTDAGEIAGLTPLSRASVVAVTPAPGPASKAGIVTGDQIISVNNQKVETWRSLIYVLHNEVENKKSKSLEILLKREQQDHEPQELKVVIDLSNFELPKESEIQFLARLGLESPETYIWMVENKSPSALAGLKQGDKILAVNNNQVVTFTEFVNAIQASQSASNTGKTTKEASAAVPLKIRVFRTSTPGDKNVAANTAGTPLQNGTQELEFELTPRMRKRMTPQGREDVRFEIGVATLMSHSPPKTKFWSSWNPVDIISKGLERTWHWTSMTVLSFLRLIQGSVSAGNIGGFISIGQVAVKSWQIGIAHFINMMGMISINLFILNLLPVPVLDGGHLLFFTVEAARGAPISMRKLEIAQQIGLFLLLSLMLFALFNDVTRLLN